MSCFSLTWQFEHVPNFTVLFSVSPTWLCITVSNGQIHVAQEMLGEVPVRKCLCVRGLDDRHHMCHGLLGAHSVPGLGHERSPGVQSYPEHLPVQSHRGSSLTFFLLIHTIVPFSWFWVYLDRKSSPGKKNPTTGSFFSLPFQLLLFLMHIYMPTSQLNLKCFWSLEVVR